MHLHKSIVTLLLAAYALFAHADDGTFYRLEIGGGIGLGFGLTDVNSRFYGNTSLAANLIARFPLNARMAIKANASYTGLRGNTKGLKDYYPSDPFHSGSEQLDFTAKAGIYDLCGIYELHVLPYGYVQDFRGFKRIVPFLQIGAGISYSPKGKALTMNIPLGIGVKWKLSRRLNAALDWTFHFTPNDHLEGLSYPHGITSSGFRNKDHYSQTLITLTYDLAPTCPTCNKAR